MKQYSSRDNSKKLLNSKKTIVYLEQSKNERSLRLSGQNRRHHHETKSDNNPHVTAVTTMSAIADQEFQGSVGSKKWC